MEPQITKIPEIFVPLNYINDPDTEDLIFGDELQVGMVVLVEDTMIRADGERYAMSTPHDQIRIRETARWSRICSMRRNGDVLKLICEYADGSKAARSLSVSFPWFVKKSSIPS